MAHVSGKEWSKYHHLGKGVKSGVQHLHTHPNDDSLTKLAEFLSFEGYRSSLKVFLDLTRLRF